MTFQKTSTSIRLSFWLRSGVTILWFALILSSSPASAGTDAPFPMQYHVGDTLILNTHIALVIEEVDYRTSLSPLIEVVGIDRVSGAILFRGHARIDHRGVHLTEIH